MTDDEWMRAEDRKAHLASFQRMPHVWLVTSKPPVIAPDRQMEIALAVLAAQEAREGGMEKVA